MPQFSASAAHAPSLSAGRHRMQDFFSNQDPPRSLPYTAPSTTPYLGLRARLSQVWINRWTILLLLVLVRTLIAVADVNDGIISSRREALSACTSVESMGSAMASMPHYMSQGVNAMTASGIEKSVHALMKTASLAVTVIEEIVVFVINMMTSTYLCLITFAVTGTMRGIIDTADAAGDKINQTLKDVGADLSNSLQSFQTLYAAAQKKFKESIAGNVIAFPDLDLSSDISKLQQNFELPDSINTDLQRMNNSIPNFEQVKNILNDLIRGPFESVKKSIDENFGNYTFDTSVFPVPQKESMSFCDDDDGINGFFNSLAAIAAKAKAAFIAILLLSAIAACGVMAWREIRRYRTQQQHSQLIREKEHDPMDVVYIVSRPYTAGAGLKFSTAAKSERHKNLVRWVVAYATTEAALFVLSLAIAGLFSCLCQYILLRQLEKEVPALTAHVGNFADQVIVKLDNASTHWAVGANGVITGLNNTINEDLFGWVNESTSAVNNVLDKFVEQGQLVINKAFGGTPLEGPVKEVLNCLIGLKIESFQKGLMWVQDNAHINLPLMANDTFSVGAAASMGSDQPQDQSFLASPGDKAADKISGAVTRFLGKLYSGVQIEAIISTVILMMWVLLVLIGIARVGMLWFKNNRTRGNGGQAPRHIPASPVISNPSTDFRSDNQDRYRHFDNVPLENVNQSVASPPFDRGLPTYNAAVATKIRSNGPLNGSYPSRHHTEAVAYPYTGTQGEQDHQRDSRDKHESYWANDLKI